MQQLAEQLASIPPQLATLLLAMLPLGELRGALPVAIGVYKLSLVEAMFWSVLGNMIPVYFLLVFFEKAAGFARRKSKIADALLEILFERTRKKLQPQVEKYGEWALLLFVGVPLPVTGAWTGTLAAFVFGMNKKKAFFSIFGGVCLSAVIVAAITLGAFAGFRAIF